MNIRQATPPNLIGQPRIDLNKNNFDALIWSKGYPVIVYQAIECPCKGTTNPQSSCQNCLGLGWVFINPVETRGIMSSINVNTQYKYWSPEMKGSVSVTLRDVERLSFMDKLVLKDKYSTMSEVRPVRTISGQKFIFTSYPVVDINTIFLFKSVSDPLIRLQAGEFTVSTDNPYVVKLNITQTLPIDFNNVAAIDYKHLLQYNVVDLPHDLRSSVKMDVNGKKQDFDLPIQSIAQKSHYITGDSPKYDGTGIKNNDY